MIPDGGSNRMQWPELMRRGVLYAIVALILICGLVALIGAPEPIPWAVPEYSAATFRADLKSLIDAKQYATAVAYLQSADPVVQAAYDRTGYLAVAQFAIDLPGAPPELWYNPARDWVMPGTSDAVYSREWQQAATRFAEAYNWQRE